MAVPVFAAAAVTAAATAAVVTAAVAAVVTAVAAAAAAVVPAAAAAAAVPAPAAMSSCHNLGQSGWVEKLRNTPVCTAVYMNTGGLMLFFTVTLHAGRSSHSIFIIRPQ